MNRTLLGSATMVAVLAGMSFLAPSAEAKHNWQNGSTLFGNVNSQGGQLGNGIWAGSGGSRYGSGYGSGRGMGQGHGHHDCGGDFGGNSSAWGRNSMGTGQGGGRWGHGGWGGNGQGNGGWGGNGQGNGGSCGNLGGNFGGGNFGGGYWNAGGNGFGGNLGNSYQEAQRIQDRLNSGNLTADQTARLQDRLARIQSQQNTFENGLSSRLTQQQSYLQGLLNSGNLSADQSADIQSRLARLQDQQTALAGTGNPFANSGLWSGLRSALGF